MHCPGLCVVIALPLRMAALPVLRRHVVESDSFPLQTGWISCTSRVPGAAVFGDSYLW